MIPEMKGKKINEMFFNVSMRKNCLFCFYSKEKLRVTHE